MAKIQFKPASTTPISETTHDLLEACGYNLVLQETLHLEYIDNKGIRKLIFKGHGVLRYKIYSEAEDDRLDCWSEMFSACFQYPVSEIDLISILQTINAIDIRTSTAFHDYIKTNKNAATVDNVGLGNARSARSPYFGPLSLADHRVSEGTRMAKTGS